MGPSSSMGEMFQLLPYMEQAAKRPRRFRGTLGFVSVKQSGLSIAPPLWSDEQYGDKCVHQQLQEAARNWNGTIRSRCAIGAIDNPDCFTDTKPKQWCSLLGIEHYSLSPRPPVPYSREFDLEYVRDRILLETASEKASREHVVSLSRRRYPLRMNRLSVCHGTSRRDSSYVMV
jgi:hypothetical protein